MTAPYQMAYEQLTQALLARLSEVDSRDSGRRFARDGAKMVRQRAQQVPEFYTGEFLNLFKEAVLAKSRGDIDALKKAADDAKLEADIASVQLTARLEAAEDAGDQEASHAIWRERESLQFDIQSKIDAASNAIDNVSPQLDAFGRLASSLGFDYN